MSNLRKSALALSATAAVGFSTVAVAPSAEAANCNSTSRNVYCSMGNAKKVNTTVKYGQRGQSVKRIQLALNQVGFRVGTTGYYGTQTRAAVKSYQASRKIRVTGVVDGSTRYALRIGKGHKGGVKKVSAPRTTRSAVTSSYSSSSSKGTRAVSFAYSQIGKPYRYGSTGPSSYDCSGLTGAAWRSAGKSIPRTSHAQLGGLKRVSKSSLKPGDIVGFYGGGHVGIYVGNGYIIHAPRTGQNVKKVPMSQMRFYSAVRPA